MLSPLATGITAGLGAVAGLGLAAGGCAHAAMVPSSRIFGRALVAPRRPGELALTFDDGPNPAATPRLLNLLASQGVQATFFVLGSHAEAAPALVRRIVAEGHLVGSHSWSHPNLAFTPAGRVREELLRSKQAIEEICGTPVKFFRPPFGHRRPIVFRAARELGMTLVLWNAMTSDWKEPSGDLIAAHLMEKIDRLERRGRAANIVLHDGGHTDPAANRAPSVAAVGQLLARYKGSHRFVTLDAWE
jgi:peptidoglycan/xylan/chitin deacetylase (PgdA/CDA1 family)